VPAPNLERRRALADAAIALLVSAGVHGVTHRAVERGAGLPTGTASNYFRTREDLLVAATQRVLELHGADMAAAAETHVPQGDLIDQMTELIAGSLYLAASRHRDRYLAIFELWLESMRRPALAEAMTALVVGAEHITAVHHADLGLAVPQDRIPTLLRLYGGALFTMVSGPERGVTPAVAHDLAAALVRGALTAETSR